MQNYLTRRNIIIAGVGMIIIIATVFYFGSKSGTQGTGGGFFGAIFPSAPTTPSGGVGAPTPAERGVGGVGELPLSVGAAKSLPVGTLIRLSNDNISSIAPIGTTSARYHKNIPENLGHLFERRADGADEEKRISNFTIPQVLRAIWAPNGKRAVIFYNLDDQIKKLLIDYSTATPKTNFLPDAVSDVAFSPDSKSMAFINDGGDTQNIFTATSDFKNQRKILDNNIPGLEIFWPNQNFVALKTKSSYAIRGFLYTVNIESGIFTKIAEGLGLDAVWNKDGSGALYSRSDADGNMLNIKFLDVKTGVEKEFIVKTIAEKCAFLNTLKNVAYCGVPREKTLERMPDAWWQGKVGFQDDFVLLDTATGQSSVFVPTPTDITQPKLLLDDSFLLFRDKTSGNLWSLKLKP